MQNFLYFIDRLSMWMGKSFSWCIIVLTFAVSYEVFVRYALRDPTAWAYDISYIMYGALFILAGAYTLSRNGHVRCDVVYRLFPNRTQAAIDLVLYVAFFFPGVIAFIYSGFVYAERSWGFQEVSSNSPAGVPIFPSKALIPIAGTILFLQGVSEVIRCVRCLKTGEWPARLHDVEETESVILHEREDLAKHKGTGA